MAAPRIDEGLYDVQRRQEYQAILNKNYSDKTPLKTGKNKWSASLGVEAAQLADGFAYFEDIILDNKIVFGLVAKVVEEKLGTENVRFVQPIPERFLNDKNRDFKAFAIYIRYELPVEKKLEESKLQIKSEEKLKFLALKPRT